MSVRSKAAVPRSRLDEVLLAGAAHRAAAARRVAPIAMEPANPKDTNPPKVPIAQYISLTLKLINAEKQLRECQEGSYTNFAEDPGAKAKIDELRKEIAILKEKLEMGTKR
jgi:hypothetical protein